MHSHLALTPGNSMVMLANDISLFISASNRGSRAEEIQQVGDWASSNNFRLNHPIVDGDRVCATNMPTCCGDRLRFQPPQESRKSRLMAYSNQRVRITSTIFLNVQLLSALRTLRHHGLSTDALTYSFPGHCRR